MIVDFLWLRFSLPRPTSDCGLGFPCACDIQLEYKGVTVGGLVLRVRFEFEVGRIHIQWNQTDALGKDFVLDHGSIVPDVNVFDGDCRDLVYDGEMKKTSRGRDKANVPYLSYEYPPESVRDGRIDANKVKLDRPLRQSIDLDV